MSKKILLFIASLSVSFISSAQDNLIADVFQANTLASLDKNVSYTKEFKATPSYFASFVDYPEPTVFSSEMSYTSSDINESYVLKIGKGGQIYSLTSAFGEAIPPQHDSNRKGNKNLSLRPFVDEVWQMVAVDGKLNNPPHSKYFIHQAGVYVKSSQGQNQPFYSPMMAEYFNRIDNSLTVVNWGQHAHTDDNAEALYDASVMYYTKYTHMGKGIIQVDNMMYNFGQDTMNHLNVPWGGVRNSTLGHFFVSNPDNTYSAKLGQWNFVKNIRVKDTGGWSAFSSAKDGEGPTLGQVFTNDEFAASSLIKWGRVGGGKNLRDYFVYSMIKRPKDPIGFGESMQFRHYYVIGANVDKVKAKIDKYQLTKKVFDVGTTPQKNEVKDIHYTIQQVGKVMTAEDSASGSSSYTIKATPYVNSYPLALITGADGSSVISTNLYHYSAEPFRKKATDWKLLGYVDKKTSVKTIYANIKSGDSYTFSDGTIQKNITKNMVYKSDVQGDVFNTVHITYVTIE